MLRLGTLLLFVATSAWSYPVWTGLVLSDPQRHARMGSSGGTARTHSVPSRT